MKFPRRQFLHLAAGAAALPAVSRIARAQAYPTRPVRWVIGFPPGGSTDIVARPMGQWLSERLGQPFVIDNRPGAGTNLATEAVVRAPPDGYTLLLVVPPNAINATLYERLNYNFIRDIAPVVTQAIKWLRRAAEQGHNAAQSNLGFAYRDGEGVPQDYVQAHMWLNLAAAQAKPVGERNFAAEARDSLAAKMSQRQIAEAQRLAREWKPKPKQISPEK